MGLPAIAFLLRASYFVSAFAKASDGLKKTMKDRSHYEEQFSDGGSFFEKILLFLFFTPQNPFVEHKTIFLKKILAVNFF